MTKFSEYIAEERQRLSEARVAVQTEEDLLEDDLRRLLSSLIKQVEENLKGTGLEIVSWRSPLATKARTNQFSRFGIVIRTPIGEMSEVLEMNEDISLNVSFESPWINHNYNVGFFFHGDERQRSWLECESKDEGVGCRIADIPRLMAKIIVSRMAKERR